MNEDNKTLLIIEIIEAVAIIILAYFIYQINEQLKEVEVEREGVE